MERDLQKVDIRKRDILKKRLELTQGFQNRYDVDRRKKGGAPKTNAGILGISNRPRKQTVEISVSIKLTEAKNN